MPICEIRPAWTQIAAAFQTAIDAGRGVTGSLSIAFVGAAAGQVLTLATAQFGKREPGCQVKLSEAQISNVYPWLREGEIDAALVTIPVDEPGIVCGPVLISEQRMLAISSAHPFARRDSICLEDLAQLTLLRLPETVPSSLHRDQTPSTTPSGRPIHHGPPVDTFNEVLMLVGDGRGAFAVGAQTHRYYARPEVSYIPIADAPPLQWALQWRAHAATARIHAFNQTALETVAAPFSPAPDNARPTVPSASHLPDQRSCRGRS